MTEVLKSFADLGLDAALSAVVEKAGYLAPTPIQAAAIPEIIAGKDLLGEAATGTGKTAAFALPILQRLRSAKGRSPPKVLILVPTRELCMQVQASFVKYGGSSFRARVVAVYGGASAFEQIKGLQRGALVVVATPGRAVDLLQRGALDLSGIETVVLDEADEMLDMGFADDLDALLSATPKERQTALFSATMPQHIMALAKRHQRDPVRVRIERTAAEKASPLVEQLAVVVRQQHKLAAFERLLLTDPPTSALVFCRTREDVDEVSALLNGDGFAAEALHGGHSQAQRDAVMRRFRDGRVKLLIATDVAARGLDVSSMSHVINLDLPESAEVYVHRIGRVGRAGKTGKAISFCEPQKISWLRRFEQKSGGQISQLQVPKEDTIRDILMARLKDELQPVLAEENPQARAIVQAWAAGEKALLDLAAALLVQLSSTHFGAADALLKRVRDHEFNAPRPPTQHAPGRFNHRGPAHHTKRHHSGPSKPAQRGAAPKKYGKK